MAAKNILFVGSRIIKQARRAFSRMRAAAISRTSAIRGLTGTGSYSPLEAESSLMGSFGPCLISPPVAAYPHSVVIGHGPGHPSFGGHPLTHADAGQMHLYLSYAREHWMLPGENPPVGLILCAEKDHAVAKYALDGLPNKVLATEYRTTLPRERLLVEEIQKTRRQLETRAKASSGSSKPKPRARRS